MKKLFFKYLIWIVIKTNVYLWWSRLHQKLFQRKRLPMPDIKNIQELMAVLIASRWTADTWKDLWDSISHPEHAYYKYVNGGSLGDCDDYASFTACYAEKWFDTVKILSIQWLDSKNKFHGHNVCVFSVEDSPLLPDGEYCISNGFAWPMQCDDAITESVTHFVKNGTLLSWFTISTDLKKICAYQFGD